jgi:glutathione S-transferase/GST-like protein
VYTWEPNSNSGKPLFVLAEKSVEFDYIFVDLPEFEQHSPEYLRINPKGTVPALLHNGRILTESTPMCEYIDAAFPGPRLAPADPAGRYEMRRWCRLADRAAESVSVIGWHVHLGPMVRAKPKEEFERMLARIPTRERQVSWRAAVERGFSEAQLRDARAAVCAFVLRMEACLSERSWLAGEQYTLADILTFTNFYALPLNFPEVASEEIAPRVLEWLRRIYARPATMETFATARGLARRAFDVRDLLGPPRDKLA